MSSDHDDPRSPGDEGQVTGPSRLQLDSSPRLKPGASRPAPHFGESAPDEPLPSVAARQAARWALRDNRDRPAHLKGPDDGGQVTEEDEHQEAGAEREGKARREEVKGSFEVSRGKPRLSLSSLVTSTLRGSPGAEEARARGLGRSTCPDGGSTPLPGPTRQLQSHVTSRSRSCVPRPRAVFWLDSPVCANMHALACCRSTLGMTSKPTSPDGCRGISLSKGA